ncbi:MAG: TonB family protein [Bacteroidetes bacterium]|nr:TonB family protein [Bacteroidota bacterium]
MTLHSDDAKSWGISIGLHALLLLIMIFWAAFPQISRLPQEIQLQFIMPESKIDQPPIVEARPRVQQATVQQRSASPQVRSTTSVAQPAARPAPSRQSTSRDAGKLESAPSTPVTPREIRGGTDAVDFMDQGGGKSTRGSAPTTGTFTRRESREQGLATSSQSSDNVTGAGAGQQNVLTSDPGTLSATPHSSANIEWDGGISRNRIAGILPVFPPGANREVQVAVRFRVRPDGGMYGMTVIQKGDPRYERAALDAMRTWRFNALPADAKQADQVGTAVFTFKLK